MGFMDKLRSMATVITGGSAAVRIEADNPRHDGPFRVAVQAKIGGSDVKVENVYLKLMGVETVKLDVDMPAPPERVAAPQAAAPNVGQDKNLSKNKEAAPPAAPAKPTTVKKEISRSAQTHAQTFEVAGPQTLAADQTYTWELDIRLPPDAKPCYHGVNATHDWKILAGLSAFGKDPDSGWQVLDFSPAQPE